MKSIPPLEDMITPDFTLLKSKEKVSGEMAIVFTVYNLRRSMSILGALA